ncbi:hypothetical protein FS837_002625, partial [Tulasnella sp. UAMH 9824]
MSPSAPGKPELSSRAHAECYIQADFKKSARESPEYAKEKTRLLELQAASVTSARPIHFAGMAPPMMSASPNSVLWMKLVHSRWLLVQMKGFSIELWDLIDYSVKNPLIACPTISGAVDGAVVEHDDDCHFIKMHVSTSSSITYTFLLSLHIHCDCVTFVPQIVFREVTSGFSGILDQRDSLFVFSRSVSSVATGFIKDVKRDCAVQLRAGAVDCDDLSDSSSESSLDTTTDDSAFQLNEVVDAVVRENVVAAARTYTLDLYSMPKLTSILQSQSNSETILDIVPYQSFVYPGLEWPLYRASILREPSPLQTSCPGAILLMSASFDGCYGVVATPFRTLDTPSSAVSETLFVTKPLMNMAQTTRIPFHVVWGPSGQRFATLSDTLLSVSFTVKGPAASDPSRTIPDNDIASWVIPGRLSDIPLFLDFDEKTGLCAAAMASGRIWVMDATTFPHDGEAGYRLPKGFASESPETAKDLPDPNPEPFRWPLTMPLPAPFGIDPPSDKPQEPAPGWSNEVDKYFPYKNNVEYYGSTPWFIHEVAHIPIRHGYQPLDGISATSRLSEQEGWAKTVLFSTDELNLFSFSRGYYEVIEIKSLSEALDKEHRFWLLEVNSAQEWYLYKLEALKGVEAIVKHLLKPASHIEQLCDQKPLQPWPLDHEKLDQFFAWR